MLDIILSTPRQPTYFTAAPPLAKMTNSAFARAWFSIGLSAGKLIMTGGIGQPAQPFPSNFPLFTLAANGLSVSSVSTITANAYDGSAASGTQIGGTLWVATGHDGTWPRTMKSRNITNGNLNKLTSLSPGLGQTNTKVAAIDNDRIYWGNGETSTGWTPNAQIYRISTDSWVNVASPGTEFYFDGFRSAGVRLQDGRILCGRNRTQGAFYFYDPVKGTYSKSSDWNPIFQVTDNDLGTAFFDAASASVGKYLLMFDQGYRPSTKSNLGCLRYNIETDLYDFIDFPDQPARWGARCVIDETKGYLYLVGGTTQPTNMGVLPRDLTKYGEALVYPLSTFLG